MFTFISIWFKPTATRAAEEKVPWYSTAWSLSLLAHLQGKCNVERLFWSSQLTGIIHILLTDTHLKERRKREQGEKILNNGFQLQHRHESQSKNHGKVITVNVWECWYRTTQLVHVAKADFFFYIIRKLACVTRTKQKKGICWQVRVQLKPWF